MSEVELHGITHTAEISYDNIRLPVRTFEKMGGFFRRRLPLTPFIISAPSSLSLNRSSPSASSSLSTASASLSANTSSLSLKNDSMKEICFDASTLNYYLLNPGTNEEEQSDVRHSIEFLRKRADLVTQAEHFVTGNVTAKK